MTLQKQANLLAAGVIIAATLIGAGVFVGIRQYNSVSRMKPLAPTPVANLFTKQYVAALDVARVFGRSPGCSDASPQLIDAIATEAIKAQLDPRILAATVAVESACDPLAVSKRGAIGLTQIMLRVWISKFDFTGTVNLFNLQDNLHAGASILGELIKQYGVSEGVRRYQGVEKGCPSCDDNYVPKILSLAGRR